MVMGSIFDTPTDEEDQNPPQPQQPPPQDPLAQQPVSVEPQPAQLPAFSDQDSINRAQSAVGNALQGVNTVAQLGAPPPPVMGPPTPAVQGQDYIDAPTNSLRAQLEQGRQGQSQYGYAGQALATALPMLAFGAPAAAAGLGIQAATQAAGLPQPVQDAASLLPFTEGGLVQRGLQAGLGGLGAYGGQQADQALNLPQIPGLGGPGALLGGIGGFGAAGAFERGIGGLTRNADPLAGIQPISPPAATGIGSLLDTPKNNWFSDMSATETPWNEAIKTETPQYQANIANLQSAQTGQPAEFTGFRQEGPGERRPGTGTFYGIDPSTSSQYGLDRGNEAAGRDYLRGGPDSSLTIDRVQLQNPLVVEGGHHELGLTYQDVLAPSPARDALTEFWQRIPENPREPWYVKSDQLIADAAKASGYDGIIYRRPTEDFGDFRNWGKNVASPLPLSELGTHAINDTEIVKFDQTPTTTTTAPTSTTTTSGAYPPADQFASPEHQQGYNQGLLDTTQLAPHEFRPTRGPDDTDFNQGYKEARANLPPGSLVNQPYMPPPEAPTGPAGFRPVGQGLIAEGTDGTIHNITGFLGARGDGEQFFQTEDGVVPLSQLTNLSAADRAELGQMRTAAGGMPPNTPNAQPITGQPGSPGAQGFQQSPAGQQFAGQGAAGMNVTQPGVSSSNAAPSTTYGGGAGGITGQAPPAGRPPSSGGQGGGRSGPPPTLAGKIDWDPFHNLMSAIGAPTQPLLTGLHLARFAPQEALRPSVLGNGLRAMGEAALKGNADAVSAHINNDFGPNVPTNLRPEAMKAQSGNPPTSPTAVQKMINSVPVVGPILNRFREVNSALLGNLRDAHYLTAADRLARTDPNASLDMYNDLWREANNATGHSTIPGLSGNSVIGNMGLGPSAMAARVQELGNTVIGSGAPVPFAAAGSRAEAFKTLMGVAGTMAGTTALASALGANVNTTNPFTAFGVDSTFLKPVTTNGVFKTAYGTGGAGYDTVIKAAANIGNDLFNGDEKAALNHALAFSRGEFGVVPSGVIDSILGTTWDGRPYSWNDFLNEAKTGFMADQNGNLGQGRSVPIPAQDIGEAVKAYGPEGLLRAAPSLLASSVQTSPINTTSQAFKYATGPDTLPKAFPDSPVLQKALAGKDWTDLLSTEKSAITKTLDPAVAQQIHDESAQRYPATTRHSDTVDALKSREIALEDRIREHYLAGELDKAHTVDAMKVVQKDYYTSKDAADKDKEYQAEQAKFKSSGQDPSVAQKALDGYYQLPVDKRAEFIRNIGARDPELGVRLANAVQPRNQSKLEVMYANGELR